MQVTGAENQGAFPIIAAYLNVESNSPDLYRAQAELAVQPALMKSQIESLHNPPIPATMLLAEHPRIESVIEGIANQGQLLQQFRSYYDAGTMTSLSYASLILNGATAAADVDQSKLEDIRASATELYNLIVEDEELDPELRLILFNHIDAIVRSVNLVKVAGIDPVLAEYDRVYGHLRRDPRVTAKLASKPAIFAGVKKLASALQVIAVIVTSSVQIESGLTDLLAVTASPTSTQAPSPSGEAEPS